MHLGQIPAINDELGSVIIAEGRRKVGDPDKNGLRFYKLPWKSGEIEIGFYNQFWSRRFLREFCCR